MTFIAKKQRITALIKAQHYEEAVDSCSGLLTQKNMPMADVLRLRAFAYASAGEYDAAIADRERIVEAGEPLLRDYYQLGDNAISLCRFPEAIKWLTKTLEVGREQKESWFESAALMLLAYAQVHTGALADAKEHLESAKKIDPDCRMPLDGGDWATYETISKKIDQLSSGRGKPRQ
jgi:tetratricopeptide (TPR) repeat protein